MRTRRFHPVKFSVFNQKMKMQCTHLQLFGNDVIFPSSRVLVSDNIVNNRYVSEFLLLTFY